MHTRRKDNPSFSMTHTNRWFQHTPVKNGDCTACHDPHSSDNKALLKTAPINALCASCHAAQAEPSHALAGKNAVRASHVDPASCTSCHASSLISPSDGGRAVAATPRATSAEARASRSASRRV